MPDRDALDFSFSTPDGIVEVDREGRYRLDVDATETRVDVLEGEATFDAGGRRARIQPGERIVAREGELGDVEIAYADGEFDYWSEDRDRTAVRTSRSREYLPTEVRPYEEDFDSHGNWDYADAELGYVWRPTVTSYWTPYNDGGWVWTDYGWTWVPNEPWGWAAYHYGRWGHSLRLGWYWIPGRQWGPAWVSWAVSDSYVGWCPLGYRDRPLYVNINVNINTRDRNRFRGHASPRSTWTYARRSDMGHRGEGGRARWTRPDNTADLKVFDSPSVRLDRTLRPTRAAADRAIGRINRGPGDVVPELRNDPKYLHIQPHGRQRDIEVKQNLQNSERDAAATPSRRPQRVDRDTTSQRPDERGRVWRTRPGADEPNTQRPRATPQSPPQQNRERPPVFRTQPEPARPDAQRPHARLQSQPEQPKERPPVFRTRPEGVENERGQRDRGSQGDNTSREVMRRFFRPAEEGREGRPGGNRDGARPRGGAERAPEVRRAQPQPPPHQAQPSQPRREQQRAAPRREKPPRDQ